ncbi:MAG: HDOD domain-containing protein [Deltaproteobacteria bacterium]|nr:HDOD domain-containing protein [Deltaproteobacteria bacterium]
MEILSKDELIQKASDPKVLPFVAKKVIELVNNEDTSVAELGGVIEKDQTITASILKIANSSYYGLRQEVSGLKQAIMVLGFKALRDLVITVSTKGQYKRFGITEQMLWDHSVGAAIAARKIAESFGKELMELAFLGGLMHDFGKVVMNNECPDAFMQVMMTTYNEGRSAFDVEADVFGYDHTDVGALVIAEWGFPAVFMKILALHHLHTCTIEEIGEPDVARAVACIHLADHICKVLGIGYREPNEEFDLTQLVSASYLKLTPERLSDLVKTVDELFAAEKATFQ